ncbi:HNH endonuclease [Xanthomonas cerealis]|uniref:HNH endonuclease n=1 Tax=Xanthomonas cerealis TaxID=3390025 RepID=UPI00083B9E3F|nr:hypothetical protein [Xanthomonas translucens]UKE47040.1 hypothetical protein KHA79_18695 [Xanthomonas translucens pv. cerealis]
MRTLTHPVDTQASVYALCAAATQDPILKAKLLAIAPNLAAAGVQYQAHAAAASLHLVPRVVDVGNVTKDQLLDLYKKHLSATKGAARGVYDRVRSLAPHNKCPLCGVGNVAHCDHHLPQSKYPNLAVLPSNLVPACHFCNDRKRAKFPRNAGEQTFHPYYDQHLLADNWVRATLDPGPPPALVFDTLPPAGWSATDKSRVKRHFDACGIGVTFTTNANDELPVIRERLVTQFSRGGAPAVQQFLDDECGIHASRLNSWQYATYRALAASPWFVNGGYLLIP